MYQFLARLFKKKETVQELPLDSILPNPFQPRQRFNQKEIENLCQSIKHYGVIQPILVRKTKEGYECIAGERRVRASRAAGLTTIPAIMKDLDDAQMAEIALLENIQKEDLSIQDEAESLERLTHEFELLDEKTLAQRLGRPEKEIAHKLAFLKLPQLLQQAIVEGIINETQGLILSRLKKEEHILEALRRLKERKTKSEDVEHLIQVICEPEEKAALESTFLSLLQEMLDVLQQTGIRVEMQNRQDQDHTIITIDLS